MHTQTHYNLPPRVKPRPRGAWSSCPQPLSQHRGSLAIEQPRTVHENEAVGEEREVLR